MRIRTFTKKIEISFRVKKNMLPGKIFEQGNKRHTSLEMNKDDEKQKLTAIK